MKLDDWIKENVPLELRDDGLAALSMTNCKSYHDYFVAVYSLGRMSRNDEVTKLTYQLEGLKLALDNRQTITINLNKQPWWKLW